MNVLKRIIYCTISSLLGFYTFSQAAEIQVTNNADSGVGSLRNAIAIAADGDVITFAEAYTIYLQSPLVLGSKTITIYGKVGDEKVHLDGNFSDEDNDTIDDDGVHSRIFTINGQLGVTITLSHLYIENGSVNPTINGTSLEIMGGGMYINMEFGSELFVDTCTIQNNTLILIFDETDYSDFDNIDIVGGGIYSKYGGNFTGCTIKSNSILVKKTNVSNGNFVDPIVLGGGMYAKNRTICENCIIIGNSLYNDAALSAGVWGGGLVLLDDCQLLNSAVIGNSIKYGAYALGGGIFTRNSEISNCNIINNSCSNVSSNSIGGGVYFHCSKVQNSIIINNSANGNNDISGAGGACDSLASYIAISDSLDYPAIEKNHIAWLVLNETPFREYPSAGSDGIWGTDDDVYGDMRLKDFSVCINGGNPDVLSFSVAEQDFYGKNRFVEDTIDIGIAEYVFDEDEDGILNYYDNCWGTYNPLQNDYDNDGIGDLCDDDDDNDGVLNDEDVFPLDSLEWADCDMDGVGDNTDPFPCDIRNPFYLKGSVYAGDRKISSGKVYVYNVNNVSVIIDSADIMFNGTFEFEALLPETYIIKAIPGDIVQNYSSTYFGNEIDLASAISLILDANIYDVDIHLVPTSTDISVISDYFTLYPNPAQERICITPIDVIDTISMFDINGNEYILENSDDGCFSITLLAPGTYIIAIEYKNRTVYYRFIKL